LGLVLPPHVVRASPVFNVGFVVLAAVVFSPLRAHVQHLIDRTFYRNRLDYRRTITDVSAALTSLLDLDDILTRVGQTVTDGLALGRKRSGLPFNQEDVDLLRTLAAQSAIAIQNALSYDVLQTMNRDLEAAVRERTTQLEVSNDDLGRAYQELQSTQSHLLQTEKMASLGQLVAGVEIGRAHV